jgi:hypothetical protein
MDAAYHEKLRQEQALFCSSIPLVRSVAVVSRPGELLDQERCEVMRILAQIVNSMQVVFRAMILQDAWTAFRWAWGVWALALDERNELWGRKIIADGGSNESLLLRHTENSTVPWGLRQLSYQLDRERSRFFRTGGSALPAAPPTDAGAGTLLGQWPSTQMSFFPSQSGPLPTPTSLALAQYPAGAGAPPPPAFSPLPPLVLPPFQTLASPVHPPPPHHSPLQSVEPPPQRVVLELNVNQRVPYQPPRPPFQQQRRAPEQQGGQHGQQHQQQQRGGYRGRGGGWGSRGNYQVGK